MARTDDLNYGADDYGAEGYWREVLPELRAAWQAHLERWPEEERQAADRSDDEPGSWRGDGGQYLNVEENSAVSQEFVRICGAEQEISPVMREIEATVPGARLAGYENRLKGESRFKEKVAEEYGAMPDRPISEIASEIPDAIRYTLLFDQSKYVSGYNAVCKYLQQSDCEMRLSRNFWSDNQYKGVNTRWLTAAGGIFEVQFHTPESHEAKELTHEAYERIRNRMTSARERPELRRFQSRVTTATPVPDGAEEITNYRKEI